MTAVIKRFKIELLDGSNQITHLSLGSFGPTLLPKCL